MFAEKAITFLADYCDSVVDQITIRLEEKKKEVALAAARSHDKIEHIEDLHTDLFLSHKRTTAQGKTIKLFLTVMLTFIYRNCRKIIRRIN